RLAKDAGLALVHERERRDHRRLVLGLARRQKRQRRRQWSVVAAHLAQIFLRDAPRDRLPLLLPQPSGLRALTLFVSFVVDALRLWCLRQCRAGLLAGQSFDRLAKGGAVEMLDKVDHIAAFGAAATIPDLLANMDGETIGATAHRARADQFPAGAFQRDAATRKLGLDRDGFSEGENHCRAPSMRERGNESSVDAKVGTGTASPRGKG